MERMTLHALGGNGYWLLREACARCVRRWGWSALVILLGLCLLAALLLADWSINGQRALLSARAQAQQMQQARLLSIPVASTRSGLEDFQRILTPHEDIPRVISDMFALAEQQQIVLVHGDYRTQADEAGGFMRYRISFPVKGRAAAIQAFVEQGLQQQRSLAFESIQFKREKIESEQIEAKIQWTLFTDLPPAGAAVRKAP